MTQGFCVFDFLSFSDEATLLCGLILGGVELLRTEVAKNQDELATIG